MKREVAAVAFLGLIARGRFSHGVVGRCATMLSVGFDTVPSNHENDSAGVFDAGKEFDLVRTCIVSLLENIAEDVDVFVALLRFDMLGEDLVDHVYLPFTNRWCLDLKLRRSESLTIPFKSAGPLRPFKQFNTKLPCLLVWMASLVSSMSNLA